MNDIKQSLIMIEHTALYLFNKPHILIIDGGYKKRKLDGSTLYYMLVLKSDH